MKKYITALLIIFALIYSCDKIPDDIIDPGNGTVQNRITTVNLPGNFVYSVSDSVLLVSVKIDSATNLSRVIYDLTDPLGNTMASSSRLFDDGDLSNHGDSTASDNIFSSLVPFSKSLPNGKYEFEFYIYPISGSPVRSAIHYLNYFNGQDQYPPVISNLNAPDTLFLAAVPVATTMTVEAWDPNGQNDIDMVYFQSYRPDGTTSGTIFELLDNGDPTAGDATAGDGIYSIIIQLPPQTTTGKWRFDFQARDRSDSLSNLISHNIYILQ